MKRRDFIFGATSVAGLICVDSARGATPCFPRLADSTGESPCPTPTGNLTTIANQLESGQSVSFPAGNQTQFSEASLEWQSSFHHDASRGLIHLLGKPANANTAWRHQVYTISTGTWTSVTSGINSWSYFGHIYGNTGYDAATGDLYQVVGGMVAGSLDTARAWHYRQATGSWDSRAPTGAAFTNTALNDTGNGVAWHPNLYGPNDGGLVVAQQIVTLYWRKSTDAMQEESHGSSTYGRKEGVGVYWPAQDAVFVGASDSGAPLAKITPNDGGRPLRVSTGAPPVRLSGGSSVSGGKFGTLLVHPGNPNKLLIIEDNSGQRAWTSTDGSNWTQIGNHPFARKPRVHCSLGAGLGCVWAIGNDGSNFSQLWKPAP